MKYINSYHYKAANDDIMAAGVDPLNHVLTHTLAGDFRLHEPRPLSYPDDFDEAEYYRIWQDVWKAYQGVVDGALIHYLRIGHLEGRWPPPGTAPIPTPPTPEPGQPEPPTPIPQTGKYVGWASIDVMKNPSSCYFALGRPAPSAPRHAGTYGYQGGEHSSEIYDEHHREVQRFQAESVLCLYAGVVSCENEGPDDRGSAFYWDGQKYVKSQINGDIAKDWNLALEIHEHTDGGIYVTGQRFQEPSHPAGWVRSTDKGRTFSQWATNPYEYRFYCMRSRGSELWTAATSSGADWGWNNCNPAVFNGTNLVWRDTSRVNQGNWAIEVFKSEIYVAGGSPARVSRVFDKRDVLVMNGFEVIHRLFRDRVTGELIALVNKDSSKYSSGAVAMGTQDGNNWRQIGQPFPCPMLFSEYQDPITNETWVAGGRWAQGGDPGFGQAFVLTREGT